MPDPQTSLTLELPTRRSTLRLANGLASILQVGDLLVLNGPLGSGKTFLTRGIARALGLASDQPVTSPTFALVQELDTTPPVVHADLYRLNAPEQLRDLGLTHRRDDAVLIVEWGAEYVSALGGDALMLTLTREPRRCVIEAQGAESAKRLATLRDALR